MKNNLTWAKNDQRIDRVPPSDNSVKFRFEFRLTSEAVLRDCFLSHFSDTDYTDFTDSHGENLQKSVLDRVIRPIRVLKKQCLRTKHGKCLLNYETSGRK